MTCVNCGMIFNRVASTAEDNVRRIYYSCPRCGITLNPPVVIEAKTTEGEVRTVEVRKLVEDR